MLDETSIETTASRSPGPLRIPVRGARTADGRTEMHRMTWKEICTRDECRGRWVALYACRYDEGGRATEGSLVDIDDDLAELCSRVRESQWKNCAILFCDEGQGCLPTLRRH